MGLGEAGMSAREGGCRPQRNRPGPGGLPQLVRRDSGGSWGPRSCCVGKGSSDVEGDHVRYPFFSAKSICFLPPFLLWRYQPFSRRFKMHFFLWFERPRPWGGAAPTPLELPRSALGHETKMPEIERDVMRHRDVMRRPAIRCGQHI
jgi:hypothetical protein